MDRRCPCTNPAYFTGLWNVDLRKCFVYALLCLHWKCRQGDKFAGFFPHSGLSPLPVLERIVGSKLFLATSTRFHSNSIAHCVTFSKSSLLTAEDKESSFNTDWNKPQIWGLQSVWQVDRITCIHCTAKIFYRKTVSCLLITRSLNTDWSDVSHGPAETFPVWGLNLPVCQSHNLNPCKDLQFYNELI